MAKNQDISVVRGTTNVYSLAVKDKDTGDPYVLAEGEVLRFAVKRNENSTVKLIEKANEPGLAVVYFTENAEQIEEGFWEYDEYYLIKKAIQCCGMTLRKILLDGLKILKKLIDPEFQLMKKLMS